MSGRSGSGQQQQFYRPYDSEDESGADSESDTTDSWFSNGEDQSAPPTKLVDNVPNFHAFATQMQLIDAAGRSFSSIRDELAYGTDRLGRNTVYSQYDAPPPAPDTEGEDRYGRTRFTTADGNETSIVMIDSRYRDRTAYPQPTNCSLRLPRIYKNITAINIVEMKLLTSFYFFRRSKGNTDITVYENGRTTLTYEGTTQSTIVKRFITTGSYNIDQLQSEITKQLNYVPVFFDYPNGINDFIGPFRASGDFSLNFNLPGDFFYNNITNTWVPNPTVDYIAAFYWKTRFAGLSSYSVTQVRLAWYYPVMFEYLQDEEYLTIPLNLQPGLGIDPTVTTIEQVRQRILYNFTGINPPDPVVVAVMNANSAALDKYRLEHTFRYYLVNKYVIGRETQTQFVYITSPSLNTSLVNLLNQQQARYFQLALRNYGLTQAQYQLIQSNVYRSLAVLNDMYAFEQQRFLTYFGVPWSQYNINYYATLQWSLFLRDGLGVAGVPSNDSSAFDAGIVPYSNDIITALQSNPTYFWPNLSNLPTGTSSFINNVSSTTDLSQAYIMTSSNIDDRHQIINPSNDYIFSEYLTKAGNGVCVIQPGKYTIFKFHSPVRQTLQVETLPRPMDYRVPAYNVSTFDSSINTYFDASYAFKFTTTTPYTATQSTIYTYAYDNLPASNLIQIPGWTPTTAVQGNPGYTWGYTSTNSISTYNSSISLTVADLNQARYLTFTTPAVSNAAVTSSYTYSLNLSVDFTTSLLDSTITTTPSNLTLLVYHDRSAFQGDVLFPRAENPKFYKYNLPVASNSSNATLSFTTYPSQTYYVTVRPNAAVFPTIFFRVYPWFSSSFTVTPQTLSIAGINPGADYSNSNFPAQVATNFNYAQVYDSNFIQLPIQSNLWPPDPSVDSNNQYLAVSVPPIGYDDSNVSTDYTDYIPYAFNNSTFGFVPTSNIGIDPITQYIFLSNSPYNSTTQTFLYAGDSNTIFTPGQAATYAPGIVADRQYKIAQYYSVNYLPESDSNLPLAPGLISSDSNAQLPYTISTTQGVPIPGYDYGGGAQSNLQLNRGVLGFTFIPGEGIWDVKRIMFRTAIQDYANDPNSNITHLGIYLLNTVLSTNTFQINLSSAILALSNSARVTYTSTFTTSNNGFDTKGGTYYEFTKDTSFTPIQPLPILGYDQFPRTMSDQPQSMYCAVGFNQFGLVQTIKALSGSAIPYPFANQVFVSTAYLDGTQPYDIGAGVVFPSTIGQTNWPFATSLSTVCGPPAGIDMTQSQTALSVPIGTSVVNYKRGLPVSQDNNFLWPWATTLNPQRVIANTSNYVMFQDTNFSVFDYTLNSPNRTFDTPLWSLTPDDVFPTYENTFLVGAAANTTHYYFLGFSNFGNQSNILRVKRLDPTTGVLSFYPLDGSFKVPFGGAVQSFTINDAEQMVVCYSSTSQTSFYYNIAASTTLTSVNVPAPSTAIHAMDSVNSRVYWMPLNTATQTNSNGVYEWDITTAFPGTYWNIVGAGMPSSWSQLTVNGAAAVPAPHDRLVLNSIEAGYRSTVYLSQSWDPVASTVTMTKVCTPVASQGGGVQTLNNGFNGGIWVAATGAPNVWATRNSETDTDGVFDGAWQIFYPFQKIVLEKISNEYFPITDTTYVNYPEYPHTAMFYYRNQASMLADITGKWGLENNSNFYTGDPNLSGYYFNSYIFDVPLVSSSGANYQYLVVRGYAPTESSETLIRFNLTNTYNFGYLSQNDLIAEIANYSNASNLYDQSYASNLLMFNQSFVQTSSFFGSGLLPNFFGSNFDSSNFAQFASNFSTIYGGYQSNANILTEITNYVTSNLSYYISTTMQYVLPGYVAQRQNFTDPLLFSLLWKTGLQPQYANLLEDWGLGYNLGYAKLDTPLSTYARATSFYKILEDYIYLRLNPEYQMNRLDTTFRENFKITRDSTGQVNNLHGKLLLNDFNTYSRSFVSNQVTFNPPIGRLDTMYFQWVNIVGEIIDNADCEWTCSLNITESKVKATTNSTLPALPPKPQK